MSWLWTSPKWSTSSPSSVHIHASTSSSASHASHHHLHHGHHRIIHTPCPTSSWNIFSLLLNRKLPPFEKTAILLKSVCSSLFCLEFYVAITEGLMSHLITADRYQIDFSTIAEVFFYFRLFSCKMNIFYKNTTSVSIIIAHWRSNSWAAILN